MSETRTDYSHPYRPAAIRWANRVSARFGWDRAPALTTAGLVQAAIRAEGLTDFGPPSLDPLGDLLPAIEAEARLHAVGRWITWSRLVSLLRNRLRAAHAWQALPENERSFRAPRAPIVITGLQRTGTTFLHRLVASDPRIRALRSWEALAPVPPARGPDRRVLQAQAAEAGLRWMAPDFFAVHPVEALAPEEDVLLLDQSLLSTVPEATLRVPSYSAWLERQDQRPAYETLSRLLTLLGDGRRWVLKTPHHLEWLDTLLDVFPDATVIMTHRDPSTTLASFCSMIAHGRGVMSDAVDPTEIGQDWLRKVGRMVDRAMATRAARPSARFLDVDYREITGDPLGTLARVRAFAGLEPDPAADAAAAQVVATQTQDRHGKHRYALEDFGLAPQAVHDRFAAYREAHCR